MKKYNLVCVTLLSLMTVPAFSIEELSEIEVVGTSLLPGLEIEEEKLPYEVRSFDSENIGNETSLGITDVLNQSIPGVFTNEVQGSPYQGDVTFRGFRASSILGSSYLIAISTLHFVFLVNFFAIFFVETIKGEPSSVHICL